MRLPLCAVLALAVLVPGTFFGAPGQDRSELGRDTLGLLTSENPDLLVLREGRGVLTLSGGPMAEGPTAEDAARRWLDRWSDAFGVAYLQLEPERDHVLGQGRFTVFSYTQTIAGTPVESSGVRILVANGDPCRVIHVGSRLTKEPRNGFAPIATWPEQVLSRMQATESFRELTQWGFPQLVVFHSEADVDLEDPVLAWKFTGSRTDPVDREAYTFFVDSASGDLVYLRDEVYRTDVTGKLTGKASPGTYPDTGSNPPTVAEISNAQAKVSGGNSAKTDGSGDFVISHSGGSPVTVEADLIGDWVRVWNDTGSEIHETQSVTPPGPANFELNSSPAEATTAQVNGFIHATAAHDFYKDRLPGFSGLDMQIPCNVNLASTCNAYYTTLDHSINFYSEGGGCVNTAYSSVVAHEYGHFIVNRLGLAQGAFGEGFGDVVGILMYDDPIVGRDFIGPGSYVRDTVTADVQYPCSGEIHYCGQLLSGVWWDIRENLVTLLGNEAGMDVARQIFVDWSAITIGGVGANSAHATTAIEVLTIDDDDADLGNGTPHFAEICAAFDAHGIDCPDLSPIVFEYPDGLPTTLDPLVANTFRVVVTGNQAEPLPDTGTLTIRFNDGGFETVALTQDNPHEYVVTLEGLECFDELDFYFSVSLAGGGTASDPDDAPGSFHEASTLNGEDEVFSDNFQTDLGWSVTNDGTTGGAWDRGVPAGDGSRGDPTTDYDGSGSCFLTENGAGNTDVDNGPTVLISPPMDFADGDGTIRYAYWMYNDDGDDLLEVSVSNDGGSTWTPVASHEGGIGTWKTSTFRVGDYVDPTAIVVVSFSVEDKPNNSITEAGIDAIVASVFTCDELIDCNDNGIPDSQDIGEGNSFDCNENGVPDECDIAEGDSDDENGNGVPDECDGMIVFCGPGAVNEGCGPVEDVVLVNESNGGPSRTLQVETTTPLFFTIQEPTSLVGDAKKTRVCLYLWDEAPDEGDEVILPKNFGSMCFGPFFIATAVPELIFNSLGATAKLGEHSAAGDPPQIPDGGSVQFHSWPEGFGEQRTFTIQGIVQDTCSKGLKNLSITNGVVIEIE